MDSWSRFTMKRWTSFISQLNLATDPPQRYLAWIWVVSNLSCTYNSRSGCWSSPCACMYYTLYMCHDIYMYYIYIYICIYCWKLPTSFILDVPKVECVSRSPETCIFRDTRYLQQIYTHICTFTNTSQCTADAGFLAVAAVLLNWKSFNYWSKRRERVYSTPRALRMQAIRSKQMHKHTYLLLNNHGVVAGASSAAKLFWIIINLSAIGLFSACCADDVHSPIPKNNHQCTVTVVLSTTITTIEYLSIDLPTRVPQVN
jgi:hypothetical protein